MLQQHSEYKYIFDERGGKYNEAMQMYPQVRKNEFEQVLSYFHFNNRDNLIDFPSGGCYLKKYLPNNISYFASEPSNGFFEKTTQKPVSSLICVDSKNAQMKFDYFVSLAGIHHLEDKRVIAHTVKNVLKVGGRFCISDVKENSSTALFLDDIVDRYSKTGHKGFYLNEKFPSFLKSEDLLLLKHEEKNIKWQFTNIEQMLNFFKLFFGLVSATYEDILSGINTYLKYDTKSGFIELLWPLSFYYGEND